MPITYKCPACGAAMQFNSKYQMLTCAHCGNQMDVETYLNQNDGEERKTQENQNMKVYHCQSCGAELIADEFTSATICSFCGNPSLVEDRLKGKFSPSVIIPFKIDKQQATDMYRKWAKKGLLTPKYLSQQATIEKISGIYAPFWLYNFNGEAEMTAKAQRVRTERRGDTEYIYTDHFHIFRDVTAEFMRIPADASEKMPDDAMDKMEPFEYQEMKDFAMPYLSGYLSERYNYTASEMEMRASARAKDYITDLARSTIHGYSSVSIMHNDITMDKKKEEYALFPMWILNYRYRNKDFTFMLNGQTGKIVAERPISVKRAIAWGIGIFAASLLLIMLGGLFLI